MSQIYAFHNAHPRWVYCPLCEGYTSVKVAGKDVTCPACQGAGRVTDRRARKIRTELIEPGRGVRGKTCQTT